MHAFAEAFEYDSIMSSLFGVIASHLLPLSSEGADNAEKHAVKQLILHSGSSCPLARGAPNARGRPALPEPWMMSFEAQRSATSARKCTHRTAKNC